ncbi:MAG TPA: NAD(P)H-hydrate dehydratase [Flavisolibacter sp.]|nr:NAD(P)H-hydrate dehydratase [Flavisolibacter sp.]
MIILSAEEIKEWDEYTITHEPVLSLDLMERAAEKCVSWIKKNPWQERSFKVFCGKGNNGGDGLAIARLLYNLGYHVSTYILEFGKLGTDNFQTNLQRLHHLPVPIQFIQGKETIPFIEQDDIVIDSLYGSGLHGPLKDLSADVVTYINKAKVIVVSIDLPSGLFSDSSSKGNPVIEAKYTLSFQCYKIALLAQENALYIGKAEILDIGLHPGFLASVKRSQNIITEKIIKQIFKPRPAFAHKGNFGHALIIAGSYGKIGAAVLCVKACLHSGTGLVSCLLPQCGYSIMQTAAPEAMVIVDQNEKYVESLPDVIDQYSAIGAGPGSGTADETQKLMAFLIKRYHNPLVIDADALNSLSYQKELLQLLPANSILTPHPKEFDRLFGEHANDFERIEKAKLKSAALKIVIVLKGHHTLITTPDGRLFFNNTGNAGMAKGGSGDVLTGIITAFAAQKYTSVEAAILGVYIHGLAGDLAAGALSQEAMAATDIIHYLSKAFLKINNY